jgi:heat-inducible transcriptional repressor
MKQITKRQGVILNKIVKEYIESAHPISSKLLEKKHKFGISPATIRIEMQKLTDSGFLYQPHTSAGRVPTDKGFRFFVDELFEKESSKIIDKKFSKEIKEIEQHIGDSLMLSREITRILAALSSNLALSYLFDEKIFWKEGWQEIFDEPEFKSTELVRNFVDMIEDFEKHIEEFSFERDDLPEVKVFIGRESPVSKSKDFSLIISQGKLAKGKKATLAILGPKRMQYSKNINLINSLMRILTDY